MNKIKNRVKLVIRWITRRPILCPIYVFFTLCRDSNIKWLKFITARERNYLFMIAMHNNGGDLAQTVCIDEWIYRNYPHGIVVNVAWTSPEDKILKKICSKVRPQDHIFIQSGFNITDICDEFAGPTVFPSHKIILEMLKQQRIVFFPQSVEYKSIEKWGKIRDMYCEHPDIVFISRDMISMEYAKKLLPNARHLAYPDVVTTWIGKFNFANPDKDFFLCLRFGAESLMDDAEKLLLEENLQKLGSVGTGDTDLEVSAFRYRGHRKEEVLKKIREFAEYKVIVTDRYHGTIFSLLAGRPVIVLKTAGHKVKSAIDWFPDEFKDYVYFMDNPHDLPKIVEKAKDVLSQNMKPLKSCYFSDVIYSRLKEEIENGEK